MPDLQIGTRIGVATPGAGGENAERGQVREVIGPDTEAGQAFLIAALGVALLFATVGRAETGIIAKVGAVAQTLGVVALTVYTANYFTRMYVVRSPEGPMAAGLHFVA